MFCKIYWARRFTLYSACVLHFEVLIRIKTGVPQAKTRVRQLTGLSSLTGIPHSLSNDVLWPTRSDIVPIVIVADFTVGSRAAIVDVGHIDGDACLTVECDSLSLFTEFTLTHHDLLPRVDICNIIYRGVFRLGCHRFRLTHWGRDKVAAISQTRFEMHFLEWKCLNFD